MYRPILRRQTKRVLNGYVCRQCQQQLAQQSVSQYTRESSSHANSVNGVATDGPDWIENFNSLGNFHRSQVPAQIDQEKQPGPCEEGNRETKDGQEIGKSANQRRRRKAQHAQQRNETDSQIPQSKSERKGGKTVAELMTRLEDASNKPQNVSGKQNFNEKGRLGKDQLNQRSTFEAIVRSLGQDPAVRIQEQAHGSIPQNASNSKLANTDLPDDLDSLISVASDRQTSNPIPADGEPTGPNAEELSSCPATKTIVTDSAGISSQQQKSASSQTVVLNDPESTYSPLAMHRSNKSRKTSSMPPTAKDEEITSRAQCEGLDEQSSSSTVKVVSPNTPSGAFHARDRGVGPQGKVSTTTEHSLVEEKNAQNTDAVDEVDRVMSKTFESTTRSIARTFSYLKEAFRMNLEGGAKPNVSELETEKCEAIGVGDGGMTNVKTFLQLKSSEHSERQIQSANVLPASASMIPQTDELQNCKTSPKMLDQTAEGLSNTEPDVEQQEHNSKKGSGIRQKKAHCIEQTSNTTENLASATANGKAGDSANESNKSVKASSKKSSKKKKNETVNATKKKSKRRKRRGQDPSQRVRKVQSTQRERFRKLIVQDEPVHEDGASSTASKKQRSVNENSASSLSSRNADLENTNDSECESDVGLREVSHVFGGDLIVNALNVEQPPVPPLQYGLDRVLFNPGVYQLQDPHSRVYNFDPYLQKLMPIPHFDFNLLKTYKTSSQDVMLNALAKQHKKKYVGSTSSMTGTLAHFHYLLSNWRKLNLSSLSKGFEESNDNFTAINRSPNAIFLRYKGDGIYAIDADKEYDGANVLMMLGKSMEKLLTLPREEYERYKKDSANKITEQEQEEPESFEFTTFGDFLMRSQLDAYDPRLPGSGMFDLKTRAVVSIRMNVSQPEPMLGYEIHNLRGTFESYEREYYDMMRSTMLKYSLQARMGRMDGIFVAYHNIQRIFGFQYLPISEMDLALHGQSDRCLGDQEFRVSLKLLNEVFEMATQRFPRQTLRFHFETMVKPTTLMWIFAEPMDDDEVEKIQAASKERVAEFERDVMGINHSSTTRADSIEPLEASKGVSQNLDNAETAETALSNGDEDYASSSTSADSAFLSELTSLNEDGEKKYKPIFAATLIAKSFVNGAACKMDRPSDLHPTDKWKVEYILKEAVLPDAEKWARYNACKDRRKKNFEKFEDEGEIGDGEEAGRGKRESVFLRRLREMSEQGRKFRKGMEEKEEGMEKVVVGLPVSTSSSSIKGSMGQEKVVDSICVDEYMEWLYGQKSKVNE